MPTSGARIKAKRRNAEKSTGPKTAERKARSSLNAPKHGLTVEAVVQPHEDARAYEERFQTWGEETQAADSAERFLVERAVQASRRLERAARQE